MSYVDIPKEILASIFNIFRTNFCPESDNDITLIQQSQDVLLSCTLVCKTWHAVAYPALLLSPWFNCKRVMHNFGRLILSSQRTHIRQLRLSSTILTPYDCPIVAHLMANLTNVTVIQLRFEPFTPLILSLLFETCPNLRIMGLHGTINDNSGWNANNYPVMKRGFEQLTTLDLNSGML